MKSIEPFIEEYIELELAVRETMAGLFSETCGLCTACCCRADICEEAGQSAFLSLLLERQELDASDQDDRYGWLDLHGCSLDYGRPPVCYTYFCDELIARLPDAENRLVVRVLGRLIEFVGENALQGWQLVEIMNPEDLEGLDLKKLNARLAKARRVFDIIQRFLEDGRLTPSDHKALETIPLEAM